MPEARFGGRKGTVQRLREDPDLVVVRTRSQRSLREGPVPGAEVRVIQNLDLVASFPEAGVEVYRRPERAKRSASEVRTALRNSEDVRFAGRGLVDETSGEPVVYTENLFVKFNDDLDQADCERILSDYGLVIKRAMTYATNTYFVSAPEGAGQTVFETADKLLQRTEVELCHPELIQRSRTRAIFPHQWHLKRMTIAGLDIDASANVEAAQALSLGEGAIVAVLDDGFDLGHPEFASAGKIVAPRDFAPGMIDDDPAPGPGQHHGTACAGVACADGRDGASGVAPGSRLMPIRMPTGLGSLLEADAFKWAADHGADVISCSWGPVDGEWWNPDDPTHQQLVPIPDSTRLAIDYATTMGRAGKGCLVFFAAGNGNESVEFDGYASYARVIAVAACNDRGRRSVYSDFGDAVFCAFPSNDAAWPEQGHPAPLTNGIWTTDRRGQAGYNNGSPTKGDAAGNYTNSFGGTSSACPGAAGVVALIIARNPALRAHEVKDILRRACVRIDPQSGQYNPEGRSPFYGYGRLDARKAVELAVPAEPRESVVVARVFDEPIIDLRASQVQIVVGETAVVEDIRVDVEIAHTWIGDLVVTLNPPPGMGIAPITLHDRASGSGRDLKRSYDVNSVPGLAGCRGKSPRGPWTLVVEDKAAEDVGKIRGLTLELRLQPGGRSSAVAQVAGRRTRRRPAPADAAV
ncbi:subtilisin-like proprotein convertase family protein [Skermanella aerolata]|uniref:S8 family serine peptidase n=1 Tax=Skermanella aerolata TaxID=393310 RepID=UPI003D1A7A76